MYSQRELLKAYWTKRCLAREDMKGKRGYRGGSWPRVERRRIKEQGWRREEASGSRAAERQQRREISDTNKSCMN